MTKIILGKVYTLKNGDKAVFMLNPAFDDTDSSCECNYKYITRFTGDTYTASGHYHDDCDSMFDVDWSKPPATATATGTGTGAGNTFTTYLSGTGRTCKLSIAETYDAERDAVARHKFAFPQVNEPRGDDFATGFTITSRSDWKNRAVVIITEEPWTARWLRHLLHGVGSLA